jgi:hypothetical protein
MGAFKIFLMKEEDVKKIENKKIDILILSREILKNLEKGKEVLRKLFLLKRKENFLICIEGVGYKKDKAYLEMKVYGIPVVDIFFPNLNEKKEPIHFSNSGLNHVLLNVMNKNNIAIGLILEEMIKEIKRKNFFYLSRIQQNIRWARKKNVNFCLIMKKNYNLVNLRHFLISLGYDTKQTKKALLFVNLKKQLNREIFEHKRGKIYFYKKNEKINLINLLMALSE